MGVVLLIRALDALAATSKRDYDTPSNDLDDLELSHARIAALTKPR
jgi:hypothetical protein